MWMLIQSTKNERDSKQNENSLGDIDSDSKSLETMGLNLGNNSVTLLDDALVNNLFKLS